MHVAIATRPCKLWSERIEAGLVASLELLEQQPRLARVLVLEHHELTVTECAKHVDRALGVVIEAARPELIVGIEIMPPASLLSELLATAVVSAVRTEMLRGAGQLLRSHPVCGRTRCGRTSVTLSRGSMVARALAVRPSSRCTPRSCRFERPELTYSP